MRLRTDPELPSILQQRFTDREDHIAVFRRYLDSVTAPLPALMFYGMGGIGKSWLLRRLRLEMTGSLDVPSVLIDYTRDQGSNAYGSDPLLFLADVRRLTEAPCPNFDVAFTLALVRRYRQDESALTDRWKTTGVSAGWEVIKAAGGAVNPILGGALSVLEKGYDAIKDRAFLSAVREKFLADLEGLRHNDLSAIERELSWRLAKDLRDDRALPARPGYRVARAVVFVDTLESLLPAGMSETGEERESLRLRELIVELRDRVLFVMAGQNRLDWNFLDPDWDDPAWLEQHRMDGLAEPDAREFLSRCGLGAPGVEDAVQDAILAKCLRVEGGVGFHAASLGLFADIGWLEVSRNHRAATPELFAEVNRGDMASLVRRFLKSLPGEAEQQWIRRLAATPTFDETAARAMHSDGWSQAQETACEMLKGLSFVVPSPSAADWFAIHSAVQDALRLSGGVERGWHERWRSYWEGRGEEGLAWFHGWSLDRKTAREAWQERSKKARSELAMASHAQMLKWWDPTGIAERSPKEGEDAAALNSLGGELWHASLGDRGANLRRAIDCYRRALEVRTREAFPADWAATQFNLGTAYVDLPDGDRGANLRQAIACYERAAEMRTREAFPADWATAQNNIGTAYLFLPDGDRGANLRHAIDCYRRALEVKTREAFPADWATAQNNIGTAYLFLPDGDRGANLRQAIDCYGRALEVWTREAVPADWATAQNNLGLAYADLPDGDCGANLRQAIDCYVCALEVRTREVFPADWAATQTCLGEVYRKLPDGDRGANLRQAIACHERALEVTTRAVFPADWAMTQNNLGHAYLFLPEGDRGANLRQAIACYEGALEVWTREAFPTDWAATQTYLGEAFRSLPDGDRGANLRQAIACHERAVEVMSREAFPRDWGAIQNNLGVVYADLPDGDRGANLRRAIGYYGRALEVSPRETLPADWAMTQHNLGNAYADLPDGDRGENLRQAVDCYGRALEVRTREAYPFGWAETIQSWAVALAQQAGVDPANRRSLLAEAANRLRAAVEVFTNLGHESHAASARGVLARIEAKAGETDAGAIA